MLKLSDFRFAAIAAAMLLFAPAGAEATVYNYDFTSTDGLLNAEGAFTVTGDEITGVTGALSGLVTQTINAIAPSTALYGYSTSPDGGIYVNPDPIHVTLVGRIPMEPLAQTVGAGSQWAALRGLGEEALPGLPRMLLVADEETEQASRGVLVPIRRERLEGPHQVIEADVRSGELSGQR